MDCISRAPNGFGDGAASEGQDADQDGLSSPPLSDHGTLAEESLRSDAEPEQFEGWSLQVGVGALKDCCEGGLL